MAITYVPVAVKNARLQVAIDAISAGAGPGKLKLGTAAMAVVLSTIILDDPPFNAPSGGQMVLAGVPRTDLDAAATGTPVTAVITDSDDNVIIAGFTVGIAGSGADVIISTAVITQHNEVRCNSGLIVHA